MTVVPRWEWRTFGEAALAGAPGHVDEEDDVYLLSPFSDASVKVREGVLDVKHLLDVDEDGLERWVPVLKAPFPVGADDLAAVLDVLRAPPVELDRDSYTLDELLREVAPAAGLRGVPVHKSRARHTVGGCAAEVSRLRTAAGTATTTAIEAEDPERVRAAVASLGLAGRRVACVARSLKALEGMDAHRFAVIDVGTNSVKLHVAERAADGTWRTLADRGEVTRLGENLEASGRLDPGAIDRTVRAIVTAAEDARRHGAKAIAAVGTAGLRRAPNAADLVDAARARCGVDVEVIPADEEARLAFQAAMADLMVLGHRVVVFDTGGGSSQFTFSEAGRIVERFSLEVGAVRFTEAHGLDGPVGRDRVQAAQAAIAAELAVLRDRPAPQTVVGMGGATTNLGAVKLGLTAYDPDLVHGTPLSCAEVDRQIELYRTRTADERREITGLQPARAEVILAGACVVRTVLALLGAEELTVSDRGLRHGVLAERFRLPPPSPVRPLVPPGPLAR